MSSNTVIATFKSSYRASSAVDHLLSIGFTDKDISLLVSDSARDTHFAIEASNKAVEGAAAGGAIGGTLGAIAAGLAAVSAIIIPGLGIVASGPIIAALAGAGAGAAAGGLIGGLIGLGFNEHEAKLVEQSLRDGHIVVAVHPENRELAEKAKTVIEDYSPASIAA